MKKRLTKEERARRLTPHVLLAACREPEIAFTAHIALRLYKLRRMSYSATETDTAIALRLLKKHGLLTSERVSNPKPDSNGRVLLYKPTELGFRVVKMAWVLIFLEDFFP